MSYKIEIKESANLDVITAFLYYESIYAGLGERFLINWEQQLEAPVNASSQNKN